MLYYSNGTDNNEQISEIIHFQLKQVTLETVTYLGPVPTYEYYAAAHLAIRRHLIISTVSWKFTEPDTHKDESVSSLDL